MGDKLLFLADLHLCPEAPERLHLVCDFLRTQRQAAAGIYILGDLFDYWIGPKHLNLPDYREAIDALRALVRRGTRVVFLCGNRDFYMRGFSEATGIEVVPHRTHAQLTIDGRRVALCHGDFLEGRRDVWFQVQRLIRSRPVEWVWTRLPTGLARSGARFYRGVSASKICHGTGADRRRLAPYGLDEKQRTTLTLKNKDGKVLAEIALARPQAGKEVVYARRLPYPVVFTVKKQKLLDRLFRGRLAFLARRVLEEPAEQAVEVALDRAGAHFKCARKDKNATWKLVEPVKGEADTWAVEDIVSDFSHLDASEFVAENPKKLTPYGLDKPAFTVSPLTSLKYIVLLLPVIRKDAVLTLSKDKAQFWKLEKFELSALSGGAEIRTPDSTGMSRVL